MFMPGQYRDDAAVSEVECMPFQGYRKVPETPPPCREPTQTQSRKPTLCNARGTHAAVALFTKTRVVPVLPSSTTTKRYST